MSDCLQKCRELGIDSRIVRCVLDVWVEEVKEVGGESLQDFMRFNQIEENGVEKWLKLASDYEENEVMLELLLEVYKKIERIEKKLFLEENERYSFKTLIQTNYVGHGILCFEKDLKVDALYYGRMDLPIFPSKTIPFFMQMLTPKVAKIIKMGASHTKSYDSYVVECERIEIRQRREEQL